ncbi:hydroxymyristoyl-ACP dehydratase [Bacillus sp. SH5-2]|nr:hydroxymyristoyl-ACP dehydratase [Bacillus sp. SH5-2]
MINIQQIEEIIPHRYPLLLIDRIIEVEEGKRAV